MSGLAANLIEHLLTGRAQDLHAQGISAKNSR